MSDGDARMLSTWARAVRPGLHAATALLLVAATTYAIAYWQLRADRQVSELAWIVGLLAVFAVAYGLAQIATHRGWSNHAVATLLALQATAILVAYFLSRTGPIPALLAVVASQMAFLWDARRLWFALALPNLALVAFGFHYYSGLNALSPLLIYGTLQAFPVIMIQALRRTELARVALAETNRSLNHWQEMLEDTVRSRERLRIARELHDVMGHKLTALQLNVQVLQQRREQPNELARIAQLSRELLDDTREIVRHIGEYPAVEMREALRALAAAFPDSVVDVEAAEGLPLDAGPPARLLLNAAQEGVANAVRHGRAQHVRLRLLRQPDRWLLTIADDGIGSEGTTPGFGLTQLQTRLTEAGGGLALRSLPTGGSELAAWIPMLQTSSSVELKRARDH